MRKQVKQNTGSGSIYSYWFLLPATLIFTVFFIVPTLISFYFSLTVWDFNAVTFCGLDNYKLFFSEYSLSIGFKNTLLYAVCGSSMKMILAFFIAVFLTGKVRTRNALRSIIFFPHLVSAVAIGIIFKAIFHTSKGILNQLIEFLGGEGVDWLGNRKLALFTVVFTDVWKGLSVATVIYVAGITSIDRTYYEAANIDGASSWQQLRYITIPLSTPSRNTVITLAFIGGIRSFELIWTMTGGGPGFATDVLSSIIYKQYADGFYGLSTAGNVILLFLIGFLAYPLNRFLTKQEEAIRA